MAQVEQERWLPVVGFEGDYEVSDMGRIRSVLRSRFVVPTVRNKAHWRVQKPLLLKASVSRGYKVVCLWNKTAGKKRHAKVGTIVMETFVGPQPHGLYACHDNGKPSDNRLTNLYYGTPTQNSDDKRRHGTHIQGEDISWSRLTENDVRYIRSNRGRLTQRELSEQFGVGQSHISRIQLKKEWAHVA